MNTTTKKVLKRRCTGCGELKPFSEYHKHSLGRAGRNPRCRECRANYNRQYQMQRRQNVIDLLGGCCEWCGAKKHLEIDHVWNTGFEHRHIEGVKGSMVLTQILNGTWDRKEHPLQVLCHDCHVTKTRMERKRWMKPRGGTKRPLGRRTAPRWSREVTRAA